MMRQNALFDHVDAQAAGLIKRVKVAMQQATTDSGLSRQQVLDRMNAIASAAGIKLTGGNASRLGLATFEKWLNPANTDQTPGVLALNVFCTALNDTSALDVQLAMHGCEVMGEHDRLVRDYGRACLAMKDAGRKKRKLEAAL